MKLSFLFMLVLNLPLIAEKYFINNVETPAEEKNLSSTLTELIKTTISEEGKNTSVSNQKDATFTLSSQVLKLGNTYFLTMKKEKNGAVVFSSKMKASSLDEMDKVITRLCRSVTEEIKPENDARTNDVTEVEASETTVKKNPSQLWYVGFGPGYGVALNSSGALFNFSLHYNWDISDTSVKLYWNGSWATKDENKSSFNDLGIGGNYYLKNSDRTPLLTAGMGYGFARRHVGSGMLVEKNDGFSITTGIGYQAFRTTRIRLEGLFHYTILLDSNSSGNPQIFGFRLGLYF